MTNEKNMISYLKGKIKNKGNTYIILDVRDTGYKIFINESMYLELSIGDETDLYIYQHVREDALSLFGFYSLEQLEMFEMLLSISGVGPKSALGVLGIATIEDIVDSLGRGDSSLLVKVSGIGKKTAERMVLELRDKISKISTSATSSGGNENGGIVASGDEIDALMALGYSLAQARDALKQVDPLLKDSGERIKSALRKLG